MKTSITNLRTIAVILFSVITSPIVLAQNEAKIDALRVKKQSASTIKKMNSDFEKLGWKVGIQSYTFTKYSLFDAIDAAADLGLKYIEATTWQKIEREKEETFNPWWMSQELKQKIKDKCTERGVKIVSFYCRPSKQDIDKQSEQVEKIFQFCKEMDLILTTDPVRVKSGFGSMDFYDSLCQKYGVTMVLTNHPKSHGSPYWNPDDVLEDCAGRSKYIGASVDVGHFMRDETNVLNAVKKYTDAGRMYHFHFRDVDAMNSTGKDVVLGDGMAQIKEALAYMYQHGATPILVFEYERDQQEPLKYIVPSVAYLNKESKELLNLKKIAVKQDKSTIKLWASEATILGGNGLRLQDQSTEATIHGWNNVNQKIYWSQKLEKGNYKVSMHYSEPYPNGAATVTYGNQQLAVILKPSQSWSEYKTFDLGIIAVTEDNFKDIVFQGTQLSMKKDDKGKLEHNEAFPDIHWISLSPTTEPATSGSTMILNEFKGKPLFDGKTFSGWVGNNGASSMEWFRIEDGCIVGGDLEKKIPRNEFIRTEKEYKNFEFRLKFKMVNSKAANGGIQFRSIAHPDIPFEMIGYQADIMSWKWGAVYDESRRSTFLGTPFNEQQVSKLAKLEDWNSYVIRVEGSRIRVWLNGVQTLDYMEYDPEIAQTGYIGLQIHSGDPSELWYKDIEIQEL